MMLCIVCISTPGLHPTNSDLYAAASEACNVCSGCNILKRSIVTDLSSVICMKTSYNWKHIITLRCMFAYCKMIQNSFEMCLKHLKPAHMQHLCWTHSQIVFKLC